MMLNLFLWNIFLIPLIHSSNVASNNTDIDKNKPLNVKTIATEVIKNHPQMAMESEGGPILHDVPATALPKTNLMLELMNIDKEMGKTKEKPIHPRKGVDLNHDAQSKITEHNDTNTNNTLKEKFEMALKSHNKSATVSPSVTINDTVKQEQTKVQNDTKTEVPKKPLKVSYQALAKLEEKFDTDTNIPFVKSSPKTKVNDQLPSPNKETINSKVYSMANKHPGMVTPIVITILVVPMFAVLGYMAVKRGQEAWKNRHYKRMDFLLDGMYND